jgi:multisubunit Na+/H+ antiporter MnhG subunit
MIEKQKDKEVFTGYYLQVKELLLLEFLLLLTPFLHQLVMKVKRKPKRVQADRDGDDNNDGEDQDENSDENE